MMLLIFMFICIGSALRGWGFWWMSFIWHCLVSFLCFISWKKRKEEKDTHLDTLFSSMIYTLITATLLVGNIGGFIILDIYRYSFSLFVFVILIITIIPLSLYLYLSSKAKQ